ncbi:MAG: tRNA lysidine(34) synthetase TilS, partial [Candidatus Shikimatogenerans sp. JK-2022]|nr:tRNA lysidine(34) synthetase TilS [Candidatus Shikimatogenerans bostrichidophilus]
KYKKKKKISIQMAARKLRYKWMFNILKKKKIHYLLTGHHIDDNIETFFLNILRKSGLYGLKSIKYLNKKILRIYIKLNINKKKINEYAFKKKIKWYEDKSNKKSKYLRNIIRNKVLPCINKYLLNFNTSLNKTIINLNLEYNFIKYYIQRICKKIILNKKKYNQNIKIIKIKKLIKIKYYYYILFKFFFKYGFKDIKVFKNLPFLKSGKVINSQNNKYKIIKSKDILIFFKNKKYKIKKKIIKFGKIKINDFLSLNMILLKKNKKKKNYIKINYKKLKLPLFIRNWENGDCFYEKKKKIKLNKIFKKKKISIFDKKYIFLLIDKNNNIICTINRILIFNNNYNINKKNKKILYIKFLK